MTLKKIPSYIYIYYPVITVSPIKKSQWFIVIPQKITLKQPLPGNPCFFHCWHWGHWQPASLRSWNLQIPSCRLIAEIFKDVQTTKKTQLFQEFQRINLLILLILYSKESVDSVDLFNSVDFLIQKKPKAHLEVPSISARAAAPIAFAASFCVFHMLPSRYGPWNQHNPWK